MPASQAWGDSGACAISMAPHHSRWLLEVKRLKPPPFEPARISWHPATAAWFSALPGLPREAHSVSGQIPWAHHGHFPNRLVAPASWGLAYWHLHLEIHEESSDELVSHPAVACLHQSLTSSPAVPYRFATELWLGSHKKSSNAPTAPTAPASAMRPAAGLGPLHQAPLPVGAWTPNPLEMPPNGVLSQTNEAPSHGTGPPQLELCQGSRTREGREAQRCLDDLAHSWSYGRGPVLQQQAAAQTSGHWNRAGSSARSSNLAPAWSIIVISCQYASIMHYLFIAITIIIIYRSAIAIVTYPPQQKGCSSSPFSNSRPCRWRWSCCPAKLLHRRLPATSCESCWPSIPSPIAWRCVSAQRFPTNNSQIKSWRKHSCWLARLDKVSWDHVARLLWLAAKLSQAPRGCWSWCLQRDMRSQSGRPSVPPWRPQFGYHSDPSAWKLPAERSCWCSRASILGGAHDASM